MTVSHHFPGITPFTVEQLPVYLWAGYVESVRKITEEG